MSVFEDLVGHDLEPEAAAGSGIDLSIFGRIAISLETLGEQEKRRQHWRDQVPGDEQIGAADMVPSSGTLLLDLGSVPQGRVWQVRRIIVGGALATSTPTGKAFAYAQGAPPSDLATANVVDSWPGFSSGAQGSTYGTHQLFLRQGEHLWIAITGGVASDRWVASARIEDFAEAAFLANYYAE